MSKTKEGYANTGLFIPVPVLEWLKGTAAKEGHSVSSYIAQHFTKIMEREKKNDKAKT